MFLVIAKEIKMLKTAHASIARKALRINSRIEARNKLAEGRHPNWFGSERGEVFLKHTEAMTYTLNEITIELAVLNQTIKELEKM